MKNKKTLLIALNLFVFATLVSMVTTGNNWNSLGVKILCTSSIGLNICFIEYLIGAKGE